MTEKTTIDQAELAKFSKTMEEWWDLDGEFRKLHEINPARLQYIKSVIEKKCGLKNLKLLDIGCGGGLISAPMCRAGAKVTGLDANEHNIKAASLYAKHNKLDIEFTNQTAESHAKTKRKYDVVLAIEVIEHVANPEIFVKNVAKLLKPGGIAIFSTINRTKKAHLLAIGVAEYVLGWVPRGTHDYDKFVKPSELSRWASMAGLELSELKGLSYAPLTQEWRLSDDVDVNYFAVFQKNTSSS